MIPPSVMAIFCEDIREEKNDLVTLVGILPDNVQFNLPADVESGQKVEIVGKLCIYVRINFDPDLEIAEATVYMTMPNGERVPLGQVDADTVSQAKREAKAKNNIICGVVSRIIMRGFSPQQGLLRVEVDMQGATYLAGALRFTLVTASV